MATVRPAHLVLAALSFGASACLIYDMDGHRGPPPEDDPDHNYDDDSTPPEDDDATAPDDDATPPDDDTTPAAQGPEIGSVHPDCDAVSLGESGMVTFTATVTDPDSAQVPFSWTLDDAAIANGVVTEGAPDVSLTLFEGALGEDGEGVLTLSAADETGQAASRAWTVYRSDVYPRDAYCPELDPPPSDDDTAPADDDATPSDTTDDDSAAGDDDSAAGHP